MLVARIRQGLLHLRTVLPKFKMANVPKETAAANADIKIVISDKRSLGSDERDDVSEVTSAADVAEPAVKKLKTEVS